ncbi:MAG: hypothetical protein AAFU56_00370 [Pseudomonadota bacterium]
MQQTVFAPRRLALMSMLAALAGLVALVAGASAQTTPSYAPTDTQGVDGTTSLALVLTARLTKDQDPIAHGVVWRVYGDNADEKGALPLVTSAQGGSTSVNLPAGTYLVHAGFGRAGATKRVELGRSGQTENFVLNAGGLKLNATSMGNRILPKDLRFSIYELEQNDKGERKLVAVNVRPERIVRLNAGTYHVLSRFGTINSTVRADLEVRSGEITSAQLQHRGAEVSMRLVSRVGGDPIANTSWDVFTQDGEKVFSSSSIAPIVILAEGVYEAAARNGTRTFRSTFTVTPGQNIRVEVRRRS